MARRRDLRCGRHEAVRLAITLGVAAVAVFGAGCDPVRATASPGQTTTGSDSAFPAAPSTGVEVNLTEPLPCRQLAALGPPTSLRALQAGPGRTLFALGNAGQGGGMVPVRVGPDGAATSLFPGEHAGNFGPSPWRLEANRRRPSAPTTSPPPTPTAAMRSSCSGSPAACPAS